MCMKSAMAYFMIISQNIPVEQNINTKSTGLLDVLDGLRSKHLPSVNQKLCCFNGLAHVRKHFNSKHQLVCYVL
jgi:hypothetical protein